MREMEVAWLLGIEKKLGIFADDKVPPSPLTAMSSDDLPGPQPPNTVPHEIWTKVRIGQNSHEYRKAMYCHLNSFFSLLGKALKYLCEMKVKNFLNLNSNPNSICMLEYFKVYCYDANTYML